MSTITNNTYMVATSDYALASAEVQRKAGRIYARSEGFEIRVRPTGEYRCPLADEWYLSGAIPEGYRAPNALRSKYNICRLVVTVKEVKVLEELRDFL